MECSQVKENLIGFLDDELSPDQRYEFENHLCSCQACTALLSGVRGVYYRIGKERESEPNPFAGTRILQHIESELAARGNSDRPHPGWSLQPLWIAFSLMIAIVIGYSIGKQGNLNEKTSTANPRSVETLRSDLFISDFVDEDKTFFINH